jgi:hypothetical protein
VADGQGYGIRHKAFGFGVSRRQGGHQTMIRGCYPLAKFYFWWVVVLTVTLPPLAAFAEKASGAPKLIHGSDLFVSQRWWND